MTGERRVVVRGRRGTLVLEPDGPMTVQYMTEVTRQVRRALAENARVLVLDGSLHVAGIIPATPSSRRQHGHRPRWAR